MTRILRDGAAVLGAILVAFALDAWWSDREEASRTDELIEAIASEFDAAAIQLDSILAENERYILAKGVYLSRTDPGEPRVPNDSLRFYVRTRSDLQIYNPAFGALSTLKSIGGLERVHDRVLRNALGGWSGELADLEWEEEQVFVGAQASLDVLVAGGAMSDVTLPTMSAGGDINRAHRFVVDSEEYRQSEARLVLALIAYQKDLVRVRERVVDLARQLGG